MNKYGLLFLRSPSFHPQRLYLNVLNKKLYSTTTDIDEHIEIPNRIPRGPTDILRALESTISRDPTATHYKYHDDPYLIPMSNIGKRTFSMAQEAGRKAAHWIRQEHADLFNHSECDPPVELFFPRVVYNENSEVAESDLKKVIQDVQVSDAILIYNLLKEKNQEISAEVQQELLELVCFNNSEDTLSEEFIEERWFRQSSRPKEKQRKTWKDGGFAEELFISLENPNGRSYSALIQGMAKHFQIDRAWQLFEEANQKGLSLNKGVYDSLIRVANFIKESYDMRWTHVVTMLDAMAKAGIKPDLATLNSVLQALSTMGGGRAAKENTLKVLKEFKDLDVNPSLGSWYLVLITYCKERGPVSTILKDIMTQVENKNHEIRHISDTNFFVTAMDICRNHLKDVELAQRVHKLLHLGNNYNLIGDSFKESIYYRHYFILLVETLPLEEFMETVYNQIVPNIYVPEPAAMGELLKQVDLNGLVEYLPRLWSDMVAFDHIHRENLIDLVLNIAVNNEPAPNSQLHERFAKIGWDIFNIIENQNENRFNKLSFTGDILGKVMTLVLRNNDFEKASTIMLKLDKGHHNIVGVPRIEALSLYVDYCIKEKLPSKALTCIQYCVDNGFPDATILAARLNEKLTLDDSHLKALSKLVGDVNLGKSTSTS